MAEATPTALIAIDDDVRGLTARLLDDLLDASVFGKTCRLHYPVVWVDCPGCEALGPAGGSGNRWATGPHLPGGRAGCPDCGGQGKAAAHPTEDLVLRVNYLSRDGSRVISADQALTAPDCLARTRGYMADVGKVLRAEYLLVQPELAGKIRLKFERAGEPYDPSNIVKGRYFACLWRRVP